MKISNNYRRPAASGTNPAVFAAALDGEKKKERKKEKGKGGERKRKRKREGKRKGVSLLVLHFPGKCRGTRTGYKLLDLRAS